MNTYAFMFINLFDFALIQYKKNFLIQERQYNLWKLKSRIKCILGIKTSTVCPQRMLSKVSINCIIFYIDVMGGGRGVWLNVANLSSTC